MKKIIKKSFVVCLALIMAALTLIPAFAEDEPIPLSESNVVSSPTIEGTIYPTQRIGDYLTITGGKVTTDGTENGTIITGSWEFIDPDHIPAASGQRGLDIRFVPDNSDLYTSFEMRIYYTISSFPLEIDGAMPIVDVASNTMFNKITMLSSYKFKNGITGEEVNDAYALTWGSPRQRVSQTGYYAVTIRISGYENLVTYVYVRVDGDESAPPIAEFPTVDPITYREGLKASDLTIHMETTSGSYALSEPDQELKAGNNSVTIVFTPADDSQNINITISVKVEKGNASFIDENGEPIVPEIPLTLEQCTLGSLRIMLERLKANCGTFKIGDINIEGIELRHQLNSCDFTLENKAEGYTATAKLKSQENNNYTSTVQFKIVIVKKVVTPRITRYINTDELIIDGLNYTDKLGGTFKVYADGELIKSTENGVTYLTGFKWRPAKSGTYKLKAEYTPADDDICVITGNVIENEVTVALKWTVKGENVNFASTTAQYGTNVTVLQRLGDNFNGWEFYDENGKKYANPEKELGMRYDPTVPSTVNFTMPDHDVTVKALDKTQINLPGGDGNFSDFLEGLKQWFTNLFAKLKALLQAVEQLLSVVG